MITRKQYMDGEYSHHEYYSQFVTEQTKQFILRSLSVDDIRKAIESGDKHLNDIKIPYNNMGRGGRWWWDDAPINSRLVKESGENLSPSTYTCTAKAAAKILANER